MNNKGDIVTTLLLVSALFIYITAFYFLFTTGNLSHSLDQASLMGKQADLYEQYLDKTANLIANECANSSAIDNCIMQTGSRHEMFVDKTDFYGKIRNGEFKTSKEGDVATLRVENVHIRVIIGNNALERIISVKSG